MGSGRLRLGQELEKEELNANERPTIFWWHSNA